MKIAYLDCASGISGDMMLAALVDAGVSLEAIQQGIDSLGLPSCRLVKSEVKRKGFRGLHLQVEHEPEHVHRHLSDIEKIIARSALTEPQQQLAREMFAQVAVAEAKVHGTTIEKVHFHEVGAVDSIADMCGAAIGWDLLGVGRVTASPIPTGTGFIEIAHGRCSIPAPATAEILAGIPLAGSTVEAELTTPTGAAIVKTMVQAFGPLPAMRIESIGYGAGTRDLDAQPNLLRLIVGSETDSSAADTICVVETNLDNATGEQIGYCIERLWNAGALDVYTTAIQMKKNRPGVKLTVLVDQAKRAEIEEIVLAESGTLGLRHWKTERTILRRCEHTLQTPWGPLQGTLIACQDGSQRFSPEFEDARRIASEQNIPLHEVYRVAARQFHH